MPDNGAYVDLLRVEQWLLRVCRSCDAALGGTLAAIALKRCPECGAPTIPVEDVTRSVTVHTDAR